ncbi:MAG: helical backbone metal receptor [Flavobacteriales bacterium]|nr:helical backbone metal receptor [Flavobacteriales bacterium]
MSKTQTHTDQLGRKLEITSPPLRIVSIVPSQTELLFNLGLNERVVGITKFCVHPKDWFKNKIRVGGTKKLDFEVISSLNPDLIIANKEENNHADIKRLEKDFPVWVSDVNDLASALEMITLIAAITESDAAKLLREITHGFQDLKPFSPPQRVLYLIWKDPYMAAGSDTFIHDMMQRSGFENVLIESRYPELTNDRIVRLNPAVVLLSSEPYPFKEKHVEELQKLLPHAVIKLVDGEMFSWYGSRLRLAPSYFADLIGSIPK